ncbi:DUF4974 domain-containing protein [Sphingobacterium olei]|uniref:DUF4974 domain-containing protein n=1 Tax=Sphingobacterium olei TaxID=2571155 RepID=A0A4U0NYW2_9SPHI|nr:FecR family protein [Sphingobacterium olei]TJZ60009.1 DUF4974 domain-containing protein [Sphingobacterium olei]
MDDKNAHILSLIDKFERGLATDEDMQELETWFQSFEDHPNITDKLTTAQQQKAKATLFHRINNTIEAPSTDEQLPPSHPNKLVSLWVKVMVAASVLIISTLGTYLLVNRSFKEEQVIATITADFAPGGNKAILTLADGRQITLNHVQNGELASQGNTIIRKATDGTVSYEQHGNEKHGIRNTLSTPRGGQYRLVLTDGTKVYLNAASSINYPTAFTEIVREVEITGEVYFEVAHDARKPFRVKTGKQMVEVLGTHFNVNAYPKMGLVKTTLLEGSVAVTTAGKTKILKPGQQAIGTGTAIAVSEVDVAEVMAWKDGFFDFTDADMHTVMMEFSRWYDLDIVFEGSQTKETFTGRIPRSWSFTKVMKIMETFKSSHLTLEGRRVMIRQ